MTQHTPGPWTIYGPELDITAYDEAADRTVTVAMMCDDAEPEREANAVLIAAAPETAAERDRLRQVNEVMLEALYTALNTEQAARFGSEVSHDGMEMPYHYDKIRAAIAAAEGGADLGAAKHVHSFSIWHDRQDRPARGYSRCACGVEPGDAWAEAK